METEIDWRAAFEMAARRNVWLAPEIHDDVIATDIELEPTDCDEEDFALDQEKSLIAAVSGKNVYIISTMSGTVESVLSLPDGELGGARSVCFGDRGVIYATFMGPSQGLYAGRIGEVSLKKIGDDYLEPTLLQADPSRRLLFVAHSRGLIVYRTVENGDDIESVVHKYTWADAVTCICQSETYFCCGLAGGAVFVLHKDSPGTILLQLSASTSDILSISCTDTFLVTGADDNATIRFDLPSGHKHWEVNSAIFRRYCVRALPDAVLTSHDGSRVIRRDLDTGTPLYEFQLKSWNLCISADERVFVTSDNSNAVCLVDLETGQGLRKWSSKVNSRYSICYAVVAGPTVLWTTKDKLSIRYRCKT